MTEERIQKDLVEMNKVRRILDKLNARLSDLYAYHGYRDTKPWAETQNVPETLEKLIWYLEKDIDHGKVQVNKW